MSILQIDIHSRIANVEMGRKGPFRCFPLPVTIVSIVVSIAGDHSAAFTVFLVWSELISTICTFVYVFKPCVKTNDETEEHLFLRTGTRFF